MNAKSKNHVRVVRLITAAVSAAITLTLVAAVLPNVAAEARTSEDTFRSRLGVTASAEKFAALPESAVAAAVAAHARTETYIAPPAPVKPAVTRRTASTGSGTSASAAAPAGNDGGDPQAILNRYIAKYPILAGSSAGYGDANGYQAVAYYKSGRIVISTTHTATLERIIAHEIWHIIDWRDNGVIDWGENVPPK